MPCLSWRALASFASSAAISASMSERIAAMAVLFGAVMAAAIASFTMLASLDLTAVCSASPQSASSFLRIANQIVQKVLSKFDRSARSDQAMRR